MDIFNIELAGIAFEIRSRFKYLRWFCRNYITDKEPVFSVYVEDERMAEAKELNPESWDELIEARFVYRAAASKLPYYGRVILHGACISYKGKGYLFTAVSGTGKSTHIGLWKKYIGSEVDIVNGDKPIFHIEEGRITAYDSPWCGKENWNRKQSAEMGAICFIRRTEDGTNRIRRVGPEEAVKCSFETLTGEKYISRGIQTTDEEINRLWRMPK
ncbi:MAG: hypothetical protein LIO44_02275 [Eubacterium sp.]|nr:hypothetical protein [Eubacterium sp.]